MLKITPNEFKVFTKYILDVSGIVLGNGKEYLVELRLDSVISELRCLSFSELYHKAKTDKTGATEKKIIEAISTNETYFFRDTAPFQLLQHKIIPDLIDKRKSEKNETDPVPIRIWSTACSTGQEVYSVAILLKELFLNPEQFYIKILGTDISDAAITHASYGTYNKFEISRGLNETRINRYFTKTDNSWRVKDEIRVLSVFQKANLLRPFVGLGKFDIILCRNVAIYFTQTERKKLYEKIAGIIEPDGYLIIGVTESLLNDTTLFYPQKYLKSVFYQLK